ncbi:GNAT family N-acetyltransferase [Nocardioides sp.]|uniref:GNAT family N-acetyltransferase n=1 Tax=Nocardioides sp. TaxID=35761 RepID=UPI002735984B|nr:GNAT family N-acetyltransferase [Nocardioides sp.]MDP3894981.1 GNAT family N-acetyltransferase [Nocardioides sp.]
MATEIKDNPDESRYEAHLDGELAGIADYDLTDDTIVFTHTEVTVEGEGVGSALARGALDDVRRRGSLRVVPRCPFIKSWIDKHPDYADLVSA